MTRTAGNGWRTVRLAFGDGGLDVRVPAASAVVEPSYPPAAADGRACVDAALRAPSGTRRLRELVRPGQRVAISICDGTRPQPREIVVPAILDELDGVVRPEDVVVLVATGTHRGNTPAELRAMLGDVVDAVRVVNHDARDDAGLTWVGTLGAGVPVWLNSEWVEADARVTTGFVEPHFFAGFSGGPKLVAPGLAGLETVLTLHDAARIGHPAARWGVIKGNPVQDDVRAIAAATGVTFTLDVVLDGARRIVAAFAGDLFRVHEQACALSRTVAMCPVTEQFDLVVTSNAGFPLDQNLYQAVKGMSAAAQVAKPGGVVVCAAECRDGFPDHGDYRAELESSSGPEELLRVISSRARTVPDQWQIQIQAAIQLRNRVVMHTAFLSDGELAAAHLAQAGDVSELVAALAADDPGLSVCVLPDGPMTIPYLTRLGSGLPRSTVVERGRPDPRGGGDPWTRSSGWWR